MEGLFLAETLVTDTNVVSVALLAIIGLFGAFVKSHFDYDKRQQDVREKDITVIVAQTETMRTLTSAVEKLSEGLAGKKV